MGQTPEAIVGHPTMQRLTEEAGWYGAKSSHCQRMFKSLKVVQLAAAASIPVSSAFGAPAGVAAVLGGAIVVVEGIQQLNQYQSLWITYRATAESLKHEKFLYLARAGPYAQVDDPDGLLAERVEALISQEHAKWISVQKDDTKSATGGAADGSKTIRPESDQGAA